MQSVKRAVAAIAAVFLLATASVGAEVAQVDPAGLARLAAAGAVVVDIRRADEWQATGVIEGSRLLTFFDAAGRYDARAWLDELSRIAQPGDPVVLLCQSGVRSVVVSRFLAERAGYSRVYNLRPGIDEWLRQGRGVVRAVTGTGTSPGP